MYVLMHCISKQKNVTQYLLSPVAAQPPCLHPSAFSQSDLSDLLTSPMHAKILRSGLEQLDDGVDEVLDSEAMDETVYLAVSYSHVAVCRLQRLQVSTDTRLL